MCVRGLAAEAVIQVVDVDPAIGEHVLVVMQPGRSRRVRRPQEQRSAIGGARRQDRDHRQSSSKPGAARAHLECMIAPPLLSVLPWTHGCRSAP
jgi:hypothetical protein